VLVIKDINFVLAIRQIFASDGNFPVHYLLRIAANMFDLALGCAAVRLLSPVRQRRQTLGVGLGWL